MLVKVKNKTHEAKFATIGYPPKPVSTRLGLGEAG